MKSELRTTSIEETKRRLAELGIRPAKGRGQNFLTDPTALDLIASFAEISHEERVLEIGPGLGALTAQLSFAGARVKVVEVEEVFCAYLRRHFPELASGDVICRDLRRLDAASLWQGAQFSVVSNLPYSISTEALLWIIQNRRFVRRASLLLQREFAERVAAEPGSRAYGSLTVMRSLYADAELGAVIGGDAFFPPAAVESRLVKLKMLPGPRIDVGNEAAFERIVQSCFVGKRKTIANSLAQSGIVSKAEAGDILAEAGVDPRRRSESLALDEFARLAASIGRRKPL